MPKLIVLIVIVASIAGGVFFYQIKKSTHYKSSPESATIHSPTPGIVSDLCKILVSGNENVPPLYKETITWQKPQETTFLIEYFENPSSGLGKKSEEKVGCLIQVQLGFSQTQLIRQYYIKEANSRAWQIAATSDLPGEASSDTWRKNGQFLVIERIRDK